MTREVKEHPPKEQLPAAQRRTPEEALLFAVELGRVFVTDAVARIDRIKIFAEHQTPRFLKSQLLLKLQGAHSGYGFEVVMKARPLMPICLYAFSQESSQLFGDDSTVSGGEAKLADTESTYIRRNRASTH